MWSLTALQAQRGIIPRCAFATTLLRLLVREVRAPQPTVSIRVVVDDLSLQRFGDHNLVAREIELAITCMTAKLLQAGCEIATKKSKVLSNSVCGQSCRCGWLTRAGNAGGAKSRHRLCARETSVQRGAASAAGEVQRACEADQENSLQVVGAVQIAYTSVSKATITALRSLGSMRRSCSSHGRRWRRAWRSGCMARVPQKCG